ncbi:glycosyltransferase [Halorussus salinisoli]|uniref:glycosyltransferase n=1 Tax=Halorussus salinisoli TaxID=2558242 RepID=UPI0014854FEE|nr:glycosyltransferase family 2 protein [Halorussus salinisoli]
MTTQHSSGRDSQNSPRNNRYYTRKGYDSIQKKSDSFRGKYGTAAEERLPPLSVVVIARNEADRIDRCLDAVRTATEAFDSEVVVVDSNSTDRTVERASDHPASVLRIPDDDLSAPAAGRYVGAAFAAGEQVLFVDSDVVLADGWLEAASRRLATAPNLAGVGGHLDEGEATANDASETADGDATEATETTGTTQTTEEVDWLHGVALYDADALASVGGFDPFLRSLEDLHLGFELTREGYRLVQLPTVVGDHARDSATHLEPVRRWRRGFFHGVADALFRSASSPRLLVKHLETLRHSVAANCWLLVGLATLAAPPAFAVWLAISVVGVAAMAWTQGLVRTYELLTFWFLLFVAVATHDWRAPPGRDQYPLDRIECVKRGPGLQSRRARGRAFRRGSRTR